MTKKIRKLKHSVKIILFSILIIMIISGFNIIDSKLKNIDESNKIVVTIDMGHGGKDQGTTNQSEDIIEKDITLQIGEKLAKELENTGKVRVIKTRESDEYVGLKERTKISKENNSKLFISIHCNATPDKSYPTHGLETYYWENNKDSYKLAQSIQNSILSDLNINDRGVKKEKYQVLRESYCPSVLIETGFLTNPKDASNLSNNRYQKKLVKAISKGIQNYLGLDN